MKPLETKPFASVLVGNRIQLHLASHIQSLTLWQAIKEDRESRSDVWPDFKKRQDVQDHLQKVSKKNPGDEVLYLIFSPRKQLLGSFHLHTFSYWDHKVEVGYWVRKKFEGQGFASEALEIVEEELQSLGFHRVEIRCVPDNRKSRELALRNGYVHEGTLREDSRRGDRFCDSLVFGKILGSRKQG